MISILFYVFGERCNLLESDLVLVRREESPPALRAASSWPHRSVNVAWREPLPEHALDPLRWSSCRLVWCGRLHPPLLSLPLLLHPASLAISPAVATASRAGGDCARGRSVSLRRAGRARDLLREGGSGEGPAGADGRGGLRWRGGWGCGGGGDLPGRAQRVRPDAD